MADHPFRIGLRVTRDMVARRAGKWLAISKKTRESHGGVDDAVIAAFSNCTYNRGMAIALEGIIEAWDQQFPDWLDLPLDSDEVSMLMLRRQGEFGAALEMDDV